MQRRRTAPTPEPYPQPLHWGQLLNVNPVAVRRIADRATPTCADVNAKPPRRHATHGYGTLVYHTAGRATFEQNGRWNVGPGDVMLIPAGQPHQRLMTENAEYWGLGVCMPCFGTADGLKLPDPFERVRQGAGAVASIAAARQSYTTGLFQELASLAAAPHAPDAAVQRSLLTLILHEVQTAIGGALPFAQLKRGVATDTMHFIADNYMRPLTLQQVARAVGRSAAYVTTALSQATGKTVVEWITTYRITQARTLLEQTDERIDAIAVCVGYRDTTHFIRMFRRTAGITPAAYRARQRHGSPV